ncbi:acetyl esterase [Stella humosa]|uniref:Acetyl esterase n=1 Tax=Stella humosa TaxID=94 RepID=A0A3N1MB95_9PROT|nr:alpha/beta hydrolase [Stella humosa]ROQ00981.1 acetyl esterase [Stella humosa]BBK31348.1 acetylhydrolase [Stella humosa]
MSLHPQIQQALKALAEANLPPLESLTPAEGRLQMETMIKARGTVPAAIGRTEDRAIPGPAGSIPVRLYWPPSAAGKLPVVVYFHGGGHVIGNLDTHDVICRNLCAGAEALVLSVDYRMGPENRFPAAVEDSWAALLWIAGAAAGLGADGTRIAVTGDSAGANLAAVVALMARDAGGPAIRLQALIYPVADYHLTGDSFERYATGFGMLTRGAMEWFRGHYLNGIEDARDWRASPIHAPDLAGVAPALVVTAECDVLRDDGIRYAAALRAAGVAVEEREYAGMIHGFFGLTPAIDDAVAAQAFVCDAMKRALS